MSDLHTKPPQQADSTAQLQQQARAKAMEEERRKQVAVHVEPAHAVQQGQAAQQAASQPDKIGASHQEAARTNEAGRSFQQWSQTQPANTQPAQVGAVKPANAEEVLKVADLQRKRDPSIKG